jgi:type VI secretion system protein VasG
VESGARNVDNILTNTLLPEVSRMLLERIVEGERPAWIHVAIGQGGAFEYSAPSRSTTAEPAQPLAPALA